MNGRKGRYGMQIITKVQLPAIDPNCRAWNRWADHRPRISTRKHERHVHERLTAIGFATSACRTHPLQRTKTAVIFRKTGNLRAVQLLPEGVDQSNSV